MENVVIISWEGAEGAFQLGWCWELYHLPSDKESMLAGARVSPAGGEAGRG